MARTTDQIGSTQDPEGSIFLYSPLNQREFDQEQFAMLLGRGEYRDMDSYDLEDALRELKLRRALTERACSAL